MLQRDVRKGVSLDCSIFPPDEDRFFVRRDTGYDVHRLFGVGDIGFLVIRILRIGFIVNEKGDFPSDLSLVRGLAQLVHRRGVLPGVDIVVGADDNMRLRHGHIDRFDVDKF